MMLIEAIAQSENIETDRPGQSLTPFTLAKKWMQTEMGFSLENENKSSNNKEKFYEHPQLLLRYGLIRGIELRSITTFGSRNEELFNERYNHAGISDLQFGIKFKLFKQKGLLPYTSIVTHYVLNSLNSLRGPRRDTLDGMHARFAMQHTISSSFTLNYNAGVDWPTFSDQHSYLYSFSPRFYFAEKWIVYVEAFGNIWNGRNPRHNIDGGISYFINEQLKVDASYGRRFGLNYPVNFISLGGSLRFATNNQKGY